MVQVTLLPSSAAVVPGTIANVGARLVSIMFTLADACPLVKLTVNVSLPSVATSLAITSTSVEPP